jgi:ADP-L-glycero-D-manno-heptose 6-epimerase
MKLFITGSDGFIGTNFIDELKKQKIDYATYDPKSDGIIEPNLLKLDDITHVVHLGAISSTTETDVKKVFDANLTWAIGLFEQCVAKNIQFQWSSSASVYGRRHAYQGPFKVSDDCYPANLYAMSKFLLEQYITKKDASISTQGFRYFNVYGALMKSIKETKTLYAICDSSKGNWYYSHF